MTRKMPWMKFYPADHRSDQALRLCSLAARGLWMECLCIMHEADSRGFLMVNGRALTAAQVAALVGASAEAVQPLLGELEEAGVFSRNRDGTIYSRRMIRDEKTAKSARSNGKKGGNPRLCNERENPAPDNPQVKAEDNGGDKAQKPEARIQKPDNTSAKAAEAIVAERFFASIGTSRTPNTQDRQTVRRWLSEGFTEGEILEVARARADSLAAAKSPFAYAAAIMADEVAKVRDRWAAEDRALEDPDRRQWRARLTAHQQTGLWNADAWGPMPGKPGCRVPADLM